MVVPQACINTQYQRNKLFKHILQVDKQAEIRI